VLTVLLDIDGVIAPTRPSPDSHDVTIEGTDRGTVERYRIHYRPTVIAELEKLRTSGLIEIVILSTWLDTPTMLDELCGAIGLTYDRKLTGPYVGGWGGIEQNWKRNRAIEDITGHPNHAYLWIDDEITPDDKASIKALNRTHTLIVTRERIGLTSAHLQQIRVLAARPSQI
jgi:hypothetical protein